MVMTESELREMWRDGRHALPPFPPGTRFSPAAQDFLKDHKLEIRFAADAAGQASAPPAAAGAPPTAPAATSSPVADRQVLTAFIESRLDSLHALTRLVAAEARRYHLPELATHLDALAAYCGALPADAGPRPAAPLRLAGRSEDEIQAIAAAPERHLGLSYVAPGPDDHAILHWLNFLRAQTGEAEAMALQSAGPGPGLARGLHHLGSAVYYLELLFKAGRLTWKSGYER